MYSEEMTVKQLKRVGTLCRDMLFCKMLSGAAYGAEANIYRPPSITDLELSTPQCLLLALLHSLVAGDLMSSILLAEICHRVQQLRSRFLRVWLLEDFEFPRTDIENAISFLGQVVANGTLKLPSDVMTVMTSLAKKYRITTDHLRNLSEECRCNLAMQLENAVTNNCPRDIFELESEGADVCGSTQSGDSFLHLAARTGCSSSITALCILNADLDVVNSSNVSPLEEAVRCDCASSVKALLKAGAKTDKRLIGGDTYLHIAAAGGHNNALEALLEGEMDVNEKNQHRETPLAQAVKVGNILGIELLQKKKADFRDLLGVRLVNGDSIVHTLAQSGNDKILKLLKDKNIPADIKNQKGLTPLHVACNPSVVRILLRMGAVVDAQDNLGSTPLMIAALNCKPDVVSFLLVCQADPMIRDYEGRTALHYAAEGGCTGSVITLLDARVRVDEQDVNGDTPAVIAAVNNKLEVLELLMDNEALRDSDDNGILHCEARRGHVEVVKALLDFGVEVDMVGKDQNTALHHAAREGHTELVKVLLDHGADLAARTAIGATPLIVASYWGHLAVVELLVDYGADVNARNNQGQTALLCANHQLHFPVVDYLKSSGGVL